MRSLLRRMALEVDPERATLKSLAQEMDVNLQTVLRWIKVGRTTGMQAKALNRRFGDDLANIAVLSGASQ